VDPYGGLLSYVEPAGGHVSGADSFDLGDFQKLALVQELMVNTGIISFVLGIKEMDI
jgi:hypothetical protein